MKTLAILIFVLLSSVSFSQVDEALKRMQLYEGSIYVTYGHRITEIFSELEFHMGIGIFPKTNIAYLTYNQLIVLMQDTAKREQWDQNRYLQSRNHLRDNAFGGRIVLYVERFDQYETNNTFLFVIVRNKEEEKLLEYDLPRRSADLVTSDVFSNWAYIDINTDLPEDFFIYVNHKLTNFLSDTKFLIETNAAPLQMVKEE
jgi:hypothetical protein